MAQDAGLEAANVAGALTNMQIDELVSNLAIGIAKGQMELDKVCMDIAQFMGDAQIAFGKRAGSDEPDLLSLIELGFTPNFYQFVDTILEVRVSVSTQYEETREIETSRRNQHQDEYQRQTQYQSARSGSVKGYSYGRAGAGGWWYGGSHGGGWGWSAGSGRSYSASSAAKYGTASSYKRKNVSMSTVDAKFASTYNYAVEGSSLIKTKIVPIPPPQVFEEIVRAKVQERREWEQQMRWIDQTRSILGHTATNADSMTKDSAGAAADSADFAKKHAETLQNSAFNLRDQYQRMTIDNWSVITGGVEIREAADKALDVIINDAQKLIDAFADPDKLPLSTDIEPLMETVKTGLGTFKGKLDALLEKLPEEETA